MAIFTLFIWQETASDVEIPVLKTCNIMAEGFCFIYLAFRFS